MTTHRGRPRKGGDDAPRMETIAISLPPADIAELESIGNGNRSEGVRRLLEMRQEIDKYDAMRDGQEEMRCF